MEESASPGPSDRIPPPLPNRHLPTGPRPPLPKRGGSGRFWMIVSILLAGFLMLSLLFNVQQLVSSFSLGASAAGGKRGLQEVQLDYRHSRNKIAVIDVTGMIVGDAWDGRTYGMVRQLQDQFDRAATDPNVQAVLLRIDSPGGEVLAADTISRAIERFQEDTQKPVVAYLGGLAASGGYYIAAPCQWIVSNELTITGSIGVIMQGYNYRGLMDKIGIRPQIFKSGKFKDMLSGSKAEDEILPQEREMVQNLIDETFTRFKEVVRKGRASAHDRNDQAGRPLRDDWEEYADGRILSGTQAFSVGFVDELGDVETAVQRALDLAGIPNANLVQYQRQFELGNLFRLLGETESRAVRIDLGMDTLPVEPGRLYYLLPTVVP
jgi:protease IV